MSVATDVTLRVEFTTGTSSSMDTHVEMSVWLELNTTSPTSGGNTLQVNEGGGMPMAVQVSTTPLSIMIVWLLGGEVMDAGSVMTVRLKLSTASSRGTDATHV